MISSKSWKLVVSLLRGTEGGRLEWGKTEIEGTYQLTLPEHAIQIAEAASPSSASTRCIQVSMFDKEGQLIDQFSDEDFETRDDQMLAWRDMSTLHRLARGYALGLEQAYDTVLKEIEDPDVPF
jgi:hypothetical protein